MMKTAPKSNNNTSVAHHIGHTELRQRFDDDGAVVWLTGLLASGKSTLAMVLEASLLAKGYAEPQT